MVTLMNFSDLVFFVRRLVMLFAVAIRLLTVTNTTKFKNLCSKKMEDNDDDETTSTTRTRRVINSLVSGTFRIGKLEDLKIIQSTYFHS